MTYVTEHTATLTDRDQIPPREYSPQQVTIRTSTDWSPRWEGTAQIPYEESFELHPPQYLQVNMSRAVTGGIPLSESTARWGGSVGVFTEKTRFSPGSITQACRQVQRFSREFLVRQATPLAKYGIVEFALTSCEMDLQDLKLLDYEPRTFTAGSFLTLVSQVLTACGGGRHLIESTGIPGELAESMTWEPGQSAWDFLRPHLELNDTLLWADNRTDYRLRFRDYGWESKLTLSPAAVLELEPALDVPSEHFTSKLEIVRSTTGDGVLYSLDGPKGVRRGRIIEKSMAFSDAGGWGWIDYIRPRDLGSDSVARISAPNRFALEADDLVTLVGFGEHNTQRGFIRSVSHIWPDGLMQLEIGSLHDPDPAEEP